MAWKTRHLRSTQLLGPAQGSQRPTGVLRRLFRAPEYFYRWRCGGLLGHRLLLLIHIGRRTGLRRHTVLEVLEYRKEGPEAVVMSAFGISRPVQTRKWSFPRPGKNPGHARPNVPPHGPPRCRDGCARRHPDEAIRNSLKATILAKFWTFGPVLSFKLLIYLASPRGFEPLLPP